MKIVSCSPANHCSLDSVSTWLVKRTLPILSCRCAMNPWLKAFSLMYSSTSSSNRDWRSKQSIHWAEFLPSDIEPEFHIKGRRACRQCTFLRTRRGWTSVAVSSVGLSSPLLDRDCNHSRPRWPRAQQRLRQSLGARTARSHCSDQYGRPWNTAGSS